jgi:hypothetical protein
MPFELHYGELPQVSSPACIHLRSKSMYVLGQLGQVDHPAEPGSGACWCNLTQHAIGPDDKYVARESCIEGRTCYKTTY